MRVPKDYANPDWDNPSKVHDWKNYVTEAVEAIWETFDHTQKKAIASMLQDIADREEWD